MLEERHEDGQRHGLLFREQREHKAPQQSRSTSVSLARFGEPQVKQERQQIEHGELDVGDAGDPRDGFGV